MKSVSKMLFVAALAITINMSATTRAEASHDYPEQHVIDARKIVSTHKLKCRMMHDMSDANKLGVSVTFDSGSTTLSKKAVAEITKAATIIKKHGKHARIVVEGYTDSKGNAARNQDLSHQRALRVVRALVAKHGIAADMLIAKGMGASNPVATNSTPAGRAANRRVEFAIVQD